jgi:hypothetical protein
MAITFPLSMPSTPGLRTIKLTGTNVVGAAVSPFTGQTQVFEWPAEFWSIEVALPPMKRINAEAWVAFLLALRGMSGTFLIGDPLGATPQGVATGTPLVNGAQAAGSKTLAVKGWTHSITGILKAGDYIQLGTGTGQRLHKVLQDVNSDSSGHATLDIFPRTRAAVADGDPIVTSDCKGAFRLSDNSRAWSVDYTKIYGLNFKGVEAI